MLTDTQLRRDEINLEIHDRIMTVIRSNKAFAWGEKYGVILQNALFATMAGWMLFVIAVVASDFASYHAAFYATICLGITICCFCVAAVFLPTLSPGGGHTSFSR